MLVANIIKGIYKRLKGLGRNPYQKIGFNWLKLRTLKNLPDKKLQSINVLGHQLSFYSRDEFIHSLHEIFIDEIYKQQLQKESFIIDCGANIGLSVIYMKALYPDAFIIAFEPDEMNFSLLEKNIKAYHLDRITLKKEAIWIENATLQFRSEGSLMSKFVHGENQLNSSEVKAVRLRDFLNRKVDFLKIDIEGAEFKVMLDIRDKLYLVRHLFVEYHGKFSQNDELFQIMEIIHEAGFCFYIKEAIDKHPSPFHRIESPDYDVQLNIFCFRD